MVSNACAARMVLAEARPPAPSAVYPRGDGALAAGGAGDHVGDRRLGEQLLEVGVVTRLHVSPRRRGKRDEQDALAPRRCCSCAPAAAGAATQHEQRDRASRPRDGRLTARLRGRDRSVRTPARAGRPAWGSMRRSSRYMARPTTPMAASTRMSASRPLGSTRSSTSHARPPSAADAASAGRNACGKNPWPDASAQHRTQHERAQEVRRAVPEPERGDLGGVVLEREAADDHHRRRPRSALARAMIAGVRLSPQRVRRRAKNRNVPYVNRPTPSDASTAAKRSAS